MHVTKAWLEHPYISKYQRTTRHGMALLSVTQPARMQGFGKLVSKLHTETASAFWPTLRETSSFTKNHIQDVTWDRGYFEALNAARMY